MMALLENSGLRLAHFALRNVMRNRRRSLLTVVVIALSFVALNVFQGYIANSQEGWGTILIYNEFGHLQVFRDGYLNDDETSYDHMIAAADAQKAMAIIKADPRVKFASPRLKLSGLIGNGSSSRIFVASAREPAEFEGMYLSSPAYLGEFLTDDVEGGIVVGKKLAEKLGVRIGETLLLMSSSKTGSVEAVNGKVVGLSKTGNDQLDSMQVYQRLTDAKKFLLTEDVHNLVVLLQDGEATAVVVADLEAKFRAAGLPLIVRDFKANAKFFVQILGMYENYFKVSLAVLSLIIFFSISNSIYMSVTDRTREFATIRTIGISRRMIVASVVLEGTFLALLAVAAGSLISFGTHEGINAAHLTLPPPPGGEERIPFGVIFHAAGVARLAAVFVAVAAVSSVLPAISVIRTNIVKGLKSV